MDGSCCILHKSIMLTGSGPVSKIDPYSMRGERVNVNAIECTTCKAWVH